jgi:hypothetical protein
MASMDPIVNYDNRLVAIGRFMRRPLLEDKRRHEICTRSDVMSWQRQDYDLQRKTTRVTVSIRLERTDVRNNNTHSFEVTLCSTVKTFPALTPISEPRATHPTRQPGVLSEALLLATSMISMDWSLLDGLRTGGLFWATLLTQDRLYNILKIIYPVQSYYYGHHQHMLKS